MTLTAFKYRTKSLSPIERAYMMGFFYGLRKRQALRAAVNDATFKENEHPRDKDGKFSKGQASATIEEIYGHEIIGLKLTGQKAVNAVLKRRGGYVKAAFHRPEIGDIDVIWGDDKQGLKHAINSRISHNQDPNFVIKMLGETIEKGAIKSEPESYRGKDDFCLEYWKNGCGFRAIITKRAKNSKDKNNKLHYILTDMQIVGRKKGSLIKQQREKSG